MSALQNEINKLNTLKESFSNLADSVANQKETNENILNLLSQFGDSVLQEAVTIVLNCANTIVWSDYEVTVSTSSGNRIIPISEDGTCTFSVKYGQEYSVFLPVIGSYIVPQKQTYTAQSPSKTIYWSYVISGVFGIDELGRRYTAEEIEAYTDRSFIKYIGYTDEFLENYIRDDGSIGIGFMFGTVKQYYTNIVSQDVEFSQELLPFVTTPEEAKLNADGEMNTKYIIEEATRLGVTLGSINTIASSTISVNGVVKNGFLLSVEQDIRFRTNYTLIKNIADLIGIGIANDANAPRFVSNQYSETDQCQMEQTNIYNRKKSGKTQMYGAFYSLN